MSSSEAEADQANNLIKNEILGNNPQRSADKKAKDYLGVNSYFSMVNTIFNTKTNYKSADDSAKPQTRARKKMSIDLTDEDRVMMDVMRHKLGTSLDFKGETAKAAKLRIRDKTTNLVRGFKELRSHYPKLGNIEPQSDKVYLALMHQLKAESENVDVSQLKASKAFVEVPSNVNWIEAFAKYQKKIKALDADIAKFEKNKAELMAPIEAEQHYTVDDKVVKVVPAHRAPHQDQHPAKRPRRPPHHPSAARFAGQNELHQLGDPRVHDTGTRRSPRKNRTA